MHSIYSGQELFSNTSRFNLPIMSSGKRSDATIFKTELVRFLLSRQTSRSNWEGGRGKSYHLCLEYLMTRVYLFQPFSTSNVFSFFLEFYPVSIQTNYGYFLLQNIFFYNQSISAIST